MPWIARQHRSSDSPRRRLRRWTYDHSDAVTSLGIGTGCVVAVVLALRVLGML